jgi:SAM-dependent methyltransferase
MNVIDVGCGPGFAALELAEIVGATGSVVGIDESAGFLDYLEAQARARGHAHVRTKRGDAQRLESLDLADGTFDLAYSRWMLCFVADPLAVLRGIARLLKPGGKLAVNDYFNYEAMTIAPKHPAFSRGIAAIGKSWRDRGGDQDIVGRLTGLAAQAGLRCTHLEVHQRLARPSDTMWQWPETFWKNYIPRLVESGHLSPSEGDEFMKAWSEATRNPHAFMLLPPVFEFVAEKI